MLRHARLLLRKPSSSSSSSSSPYFPKQNPFLLPENTFSNSKHIQQQQQQQQQWLLRHVTGLASSPSLSIWRRKKEMGKEGLIVAKELKRLRSNSVRLDRFIRSHLYDVVRKEIWYRPDMFFYRDMLMMLARNKSVDEAKRVWEDLKREEVLFDQHTFGDLIRAFSDSGLPSEAMEIYDEMRQSPDPPISLPFRVILKGLIPYPELREKVKDDFLELFPGMVVYDPPEDLFEDQDWRRESEDD
ncbi:pentatricopeptide repeat-containing protein [Quercus suber]|uniref:Pentatricopeptide repeat-containing protein n=1 Tax=Quercus suber TaxID=58331 RepID=A0AAW0KK10_QUESU